MNKNFSPAQLHKVGESLFGARKLTDEQIEAKLAELEAAEKAIPQETEAEALQRLHTAVRNGLFKDMSND